MRKCEECIYLCEGDEDPEKCKHYKKGKKVCGGSNEHM